MQGGVIFLCSATSGPEAFMWPIGTTAAAVNHLVTKGRAIRAPFFFAPDVPLDLARSCAKSLARLERVKGIEPSYAAWEAAVLPLNYTRTATAFATV